MRFSVVLCSLVMLMTPPVVMAEERHLGRFIFEEAEAAFAERNYAQALRKLDEAERAMGKTNPRILYLRVMAGYELLKQGPLQYEAAIRVRNEADKFLISFSKEKALVGLAREIYGVRRDLDARLQQDKALLETQLKQARAGDTHSMRALISRYQNGLGVSPDSEEAKYWEQRLNEANAKEDLRLASGGDMAAMLRVANRYAAGDGLRRNEQQAKEWQARYGAAKAEEDVRIARQQAEAAEAARQAAIQKRLDEINFTEYTEEMFTLLENGDHVPSATFTLSSIPLTLGGMFTDVLSTPTKVTEMIELQSQASVRAAAWGNPDSMMNQAYGLYWGEQGESLANR